MRYWKCIGNEFNKYFTIDKIYSTDDNGHDIKDDKNGKYQTQVTEMCSAKFEEVKEEEGNKMESEKGNFKVKCLDVRGYDKYYTKGKIYEVVDGVFTYDDGDVFGNITSFDDFNASTFAIWELIEDSSDLRTMLKQGCVVVHVDDTLSKVEMNNEGKLVISGDDHWCCVSSLAKNLSGYMEDQSADIKEVYGHSRYNQYAHTVSLYGRELIWKRTEISPTQLKLEELEKKQREIADEMEKLRKEL